MVAATDQNRSSQGNITRNVNTAYPSDGVLVATFKPKNGALAGKTMSGDMPEARTLSTTGGAISSVLDISIYVSRNAKFTSGPGLKVPRSLGVFQAMQTAFFVNHSMNLSDARAKANSIIRGSFYILEIELKILMGQKKWGHQKQNKFMKTRTLTIILLLIHSVSISQTIDMRRVTTYDVGRAVFYVIKKSLFDLKPLIKSGELRIYRDSGLKELINNKELDSMAVFKNLVSDLGNNSLIEEWFFGYDRADVVIVNDRSLQLCIKIDSYDVPEIIEDTILSLCYVSIEDLQRIKDTDLKTIFYSFIYNYCYKRMSRDTIDTKGRRSFAIDLYEMFSSIYKRKNVDLYTGDYKDYEANRSNTVFFSRENAKMHNESLELIDWNERESVFNTEYDWFEIFIAYSSYERGHNMVCNIEYFGSFLPYKYEQNAINRRTKCYGIKPKELVRVLDPLFEYMLKRVFKEVLYNPALAK